MLETYEILELERRWRAYDKKRKEFKFSDKKNYIYAISAVLAISVSDRKSRATHSAVRTYRIISSVSLLILRVLSHGRSIYFYFADASARTSSDTASTCLDGYYLYCETKSKLLNIRIKLLNVTNASIYGFVNIQYCYIYAKFPIVSSSFFI